jgi:hypothetical protein
MSEDRVPVILTHSRASGVFSFEEGFLTLYDSLSNSHISFSAVIVEPAHDQHACITKEELRLYVCNRFKEPSEMSENNLLVYHNKIPLSITYDTLFENRAIHSGQYGFIRAETQKLLVIASLHSAHSTSSLDTVEDETLEDPDILNPFEVVPDIVEDVNGPMACLPVVLSQGASTLQVDAPGSYGVPSDSAVELAVQALSEPYPMFALVTNSLNAGFVIRSGGITSILPPFSTVVVPVPTVNENGGFKTTALWWVSLPKRALRIARTTMQEMDSLEGDIAGVKHRVLSGQFLRSAGRQCRKMNERLDALQICITCVLSSYDELLLHMKSTPQRWCGTVDEETRSVLLWREEASNVEEKIERARETLNSIRTHELRVRALYDNELRPRLLVSSLK